MKDVISANQDTAVLNKVGAAEKKSVNSQMDDQAEMVNFLSKNRGADIPKMLREQKERLAPFAEIKGQITKEVNKLIKEDYQKKVDRYLTEKGRWEAQEETKKAIVDDFIKSDLKYLHFAEKLKTNASHLNELPAIDSSFQATPSVHVLSGMTDSSETLDFVFPPYIDAWTDSQSQNAWADKDSGRFGFTHSVGEHGSSGPGTIAGSGSAYSAAGIVVHFVPRYPSGRIQIRPLLPYSYSYVLSSFLSNPHAKCLINCEIYSYDLQGGDVTREREFGYWIWNDSLLVGLGFITGQNTNPSYPHPDNEHGFILPSQEIPDFRVRPDRIYYAHFSIFGNSDASGFSITSLSWTRSNVDATIPMVVIAQSI